MIDRMALEEENVRAMGQRKKYLEQMALKELKLRRRSLE